MTFQRFGPFEVHSDEWHAHRRTCIGASEVAAILGVEGAYGTPLKIWADKRGLLEKDPEEDEKKWWLRLGQAMEPVIADEFAHRTGFAVDEEDQQFVSTEWPFLGCSLDRWYIPQDHYPLELKHTSGWMRHRWEEGIWLPYQVQVQAQMAVTGAPVAAVAVLVGGADFHWQEVERNDRFIEAMVEKLDRFWEMVENDRMPDPTGADFKLIGTLLGPEEPKTTIALSPAMQDLDDELLGIKEEIKGLEIRKKEIEAKLKKEIGTNEKGVLPSGGAYTFKTVTRKEFIIPAGESRQLRRIGKK